MSQTKITAYFEVAPDGNDSSPLFITQELQLKDLHRIGRVYDLIKRGELSMAKFAGGGLPATKNPEGHALWVADCRIEENGEVTLEIDENHGTANYETTPVSIAALEAAFLMHPVAFLGFDPCRNTETEARAHFEESIGFDRDEFHDFVVSHGFGGPTEEAYQWAAQQYAQEKDYAGIAADVVTQGWVDEPHTPGMGY